MPKIALISDIHANLPALQAVVEALEKEQPDQWLCMGDLVGYGPHPSECINLVREKNMQCVMGNHDAGIAGLLPDKYFRRPNRHLIELTAEELITKDQKEWLAALPYTLEGIFGENPGMKWKAVHASPDEPESWEYLDSAFRVRKLLENMEERFCFVGHTHKPALVSETIGLKEFKEGHKYMINPGSVGQSRDGDYRASAGILDTDNYLYRNIRCHFDQEKVLADLEKLGFSRRAAEHMMAPNRRDE